MTDVKAKDEVVDDNSSDDASIIASLAERLRFFFSNANLRQDRWLRDHLSSSSSDSGGGGGGDDGGGVCDGPIALTVLLRFNTLKSISTNKELLIKAATSDSVKDVLLYDNTTQSVKRVESFNYKTMGDGSQLSLYVKNIPILMEDPATAAITTVKKEEEDNDKVKGGGAEDKEEGGADVVNNNSNATTTTTKFRPRYDVTREEIKSLFDCYGRVGIIQLRYGKKSAATTTTQGSGSGSGSGSSESYPLGVAIVEFESLDGLQKACNDLLVTTTTKDDDDTDKDGDNEGKSSQTNKVLTLKGNTLVVEKMRPSKFFQSFNNSKKKRTCDDDDNEDDNEDDEVNAKNDKDEATFTAAAVEFEPIILDWEKGCVITLIGLDSTTCDRESLREAVSSTLGIASTTDVKTSGLYVDYNRGDTTANLRLKESKPTEMAELVSKLLDGSILIANSKVESAKILMGEEEEQYYEKFIDWLNTRKKMKEEERWMNNNNNKRQKFGGGGGGGGGRGGGRGRGGRGGGRGRGGRGRR